MPHAPQFFERVGCGLAVVLVAVAVVAHAPQPIGTHLSFLHAASALSSSQWWPHVPQLSCRRARPRSRAGLVVAVAIVVGALHDQALAGDARRRPRDRPCRRRARPRRPCRRSRRLRVALLGADHRAVPSSPDWACNRPAPERRPCPSSPRCRRRRDYHPSRPGPAGPRCRDAPASRPWHRSHRRPPVP